MVVVNKRMNEEIDQCQYGCIDQRGDRRPGPHVNTRQAVGENAVERPRKDSSRGIEGCYQQRAEWRSDVSQAKDDRPYLRCRQHRDEEEVVGAVSERIGLAAGVRQRGRRADEGEADCAASRREREDDEQTGNDHRADRAP